MRQMIDSEMVDEMVSHHLIIINLKRGDEWLKGEVATSGDLVSNNRNDYIMVSEMMVKDKMV